MSVVHVWSATALLVACAAAFAGEPAQPPPPPVPGEGEPKPKTEEEILWEKIAEALAPLKTVMEQEPDAQDKAWEKAEADLKGLGAKAVPMLEALLPRKNEKEKVVFSEKLKELLGREDSEAELVVKRVLHTHGWVSPADRSKRESLLKELPDPETSAESLFTGFVELGWFGVEGLREEYGKADAKMKEKILKILSLMAKQGSQDLTALLLDLSVDKDVQVRVKSLGALADLADGAEDRAFQALDKLLEKEGAYALLVGHLRLDAEPDVRMYAARVLGLMEVKGAAQELVNALDDPKEKVADEAAHALTRLDPAIQVSDDPVKKIKGLKNWWAQSKGSFSAQIKAAPPARGQKAPSKEGEK